MTHTNLAPYIYSSDVSLIYFYSAHFGNFCWTCFNPECFSCRCRRSTSSTPRPLIAWDRLDSCLKQPQRPLKIIMLRGLSRRKDSLLVPGTADTNCWKLSPDTKKDEAKCLVSGKLRRQSSVNFPGAVLMFVNCLYTCNVPTYTSSRSQPGRRYKKEDTPFILCRLSKQWD